MAKKRRILELDELPANAAGSPVVTRDIAATLTYADGTHETFHSHEGEGVVASCCSSGDCNPAVENCNE